MVSQANQPRRLRNERNACFINASIQALSVTSSVQDLTVGANHLNQVTNSLSTLLRGQKELTKSVSDLRQLVARTAHGASINDGQQQDAAFFIEKLLESLKYENPQWDERTFGGEESFTYRFANTDNGLCKSCGYSPPTIHQAFKILNIGNSDHVTSLYGHIKGRGSTSFGSMKCSNCCPHDDRKNSSVCQCLQFPMETNWKLEKFPNILIFQVESGAPQSIAKDTNKLIPNPSLTLGDGSKYAFKSVIQHHSSEIGSGHYTALVTTKKPHIFLKCDDQAPLQEVDLHSSERKLNDDYLYIYEKSCIDHEKLTQYSKRKRETLNNRCMR